MPRLFVRRRKFKIRGPYEAMVDDLAHDGRGIVHRDGEAVFVHGALPGERIQYEITGKRKGVKVGRVLEISEASPARVEPPCEHYDICGGCSLQHLHPDEQLKFKQSRLQRALSQAGSVEPQEWLPALTGPTQGYRRRARLGVKDVPGKGRVLVGFRERGNPYIADMTACKTLVPQAAELLQPLSAMIAELSVRQKVPQVEVAHADNAMALIFRVLESPSPEDALKLSQFGQTHRLQIFLQPGGMDSVASLDAVPPEPLNYQLPSASEAPPLKLEFKPFDFIQVNAQLNERMLAQTMQLLDARPEDRVLELFAGLGNFTLPLAQQVSEVIAVEGDAGLVARARDNALGNDLQNIQHYTADLFDESAEKPWLAAAAGCELVLLDPPRSGAKEVLADIAALQARRIVYISCHPETLARDAQTLTQQYGYQLGQAGVMDMFPHTAHIESMAVFDRP